MAGLYIHVPFCKSRCIYCGFYSTTLEELRQRYVDAVCREMETRSSLPPTPSEERGHLETIYLGGGTPSQLTVAQLEQLFIYINKVYGLPLAKVGGRKRLEITMECNPDDVTPEFAAALRQLPVNRVSMGAQTFDDDRLRFLHRRHSARQVAEAVERLRQVGIKNISIDLMYGFPGETIDDWHRDIEQALALNVEHLSAYALMFEEGTPLYRMLQQGQVKEPDEELSLQMYADLIDRVTDAGYEHYEISNFARTGYRSRHNSSYWNQTPYIGLGAAAHSYDGRRRYWNVDHVQRYIEGMENGQPCRDYEELDTDTRYNDMVLTSLRTCEGLSLALLPTDLQTYCLQQAERFLADGLLRLADNRLVLTRRGLFVSNMVMSQLMKC